MNHWLVKSEPEAFSWQDCLRDGKAIWDGVRNYTARNNLVAMKKGDLVFFYHSVTGKEVVGLAQVGREAFPDPTDTTGKWMAVELLPVVSLNKPVTLQAVRDTPALHQLWLVRQPRLSVMPVSQPEFDTLMSMSDTKL